MYHATHEPGLFSLVRRRWRCMGVTLALTMSLGAGALLVMPKIYQATAKIMVTRSEQRMGGLPVVNDALPELTGAGHPLYTQVELLCIALVFEDVIARLGLKTKEGKPVTVEQLGKEVRITPIDKTDLIEVQYEDNNPERARLVVDDICATYIRLSEAYREQGVREGLSYVERQLDAAKTRLAAAEEAFQAFTSQVEMPREVQGTVDELILLNGAIREQEAALAGARSRAGQLRSRLGMDPAAGLRRLSQSQDLRMRMLQDQLAQAEASLLWSQGLQPDQPELQAPAQPSLVVNDQRPAQEVPRDLEVASRVYQDLQKEREEAAVALAMAPAFARVIQPAVLSDGPLSPVKAPAAPVVIMLGLAAAFCVGAIRDLLKQPDVVEAGRLVSRLPLLTVLPAGTSEKSISEQAPRAIAGALETRASREGGRALGLTSLQAGEGRTSCVVALAEQLAHQGHRVLVVEADFRNPRLAEHRGLDPSVSGFGEVLLEGRSPASVVRKSGEIYVVTAGPGLTASMARLVERRVASMIQAWQDEYDFVLLDLPPLPAAEPVPAFARATEGVLLLVNHAQVTSDQLLKGLGRLQEGGFTLLGVLPVEHDHPGDVSPFAGPHPQAS